MQPETNCKCEICGTKFYAVRSRILKGGAKYCSTKCSGIGRKGKLSGENHPNWQGKTFLSRCEICGNEFKTTDSKIKCGKGRYCSVKCSDIAKKTGTYNTCLYCGTNFYKHLESTRKFCSKKCYYSWLISENRKNLISRPTNPIVDGTTKYIELTKGKVTIVDSSFYDYLNQFKWHAVNMGGYRAYRRDGKKLIAMSRDILDAPVGKVVDHINHNTLDNRLQNLRICTEAENHYNKIISSLNTSGYKGVTWHRGAKKWRVRVNGNHIGFFYDKLTAARAYDDAASKIHGEFAHLNFKNVMEAGE